jgi:hypothetical protein
MVVSFKVLFILVLYIYCSVHSSNRTFFRYSTMSRRFRLSSSERIDIVKWYAVYQNAAEVARQFQHHYERAPPTRESILDITRRFEACQSSCVKELVDQYRKDYNFAKTWRVNTLSIFCETFCNKNTSKMSIFLCAISFFC